MPSATIPVGAQTEAVVLFSVLVVVLLIICLPCVISLSNTTSVFLIAVKSIVEKFLYIYVPFAIGFSTLILITVISRLEHWSFNSVVFGLIALCTEVLDLTLSLLQNVTTLLVVLLLWVYRERVFKAIGVENPSLLLKGKC